VGVGGSDDQRSQFLVAKPQHEMGGEIVCSILFATEDRNSSLQLVPEPVAAFVDAFTGVFADTSAARRPPPRHPALLAARADY
jgi:hypothetical protein